MYAKRFCTMSGFLNDSLIEILRYIDSEYKQKLMQYNHDSNWLDVDALTSLTGAECRTESGVIPSNAAVAANLYEIEEESSEIFSNEDGHQQQQQENFCDEFQQQEENNLFDINLKCNELKEEINRLRKISMKSLKFCGKLIADLELAAKYEVTSGVQELLDDLVASNHALVQFTNPEFVNNSSASFMLFIPHEFARDKIQILRLLFIISEKDDPGTLSGHANRQTSGEDAEAAASGGGGGPVVGDQNLFNETIFKVKVLNNLSAQLFIFSRSFNHYF